MAPKKPIRTPLTKNSGPETRGKAKIAAGKAYENTPKRDKWYGESIPFSLREDGGRLLAEAYARGVTPKTKPKLPKDIAYANKSPGRSPTGPKKKK